MYVFKFYDENDTIIHECKNFKTNAGDNLKDDLNQIDIFYVKLDDNYSIIKIELILSILDNITKFISCKLNNRLKSNYLTAKHYKKIHTLSIKNNLADIENDISLNSSNSSKIETNLEKINNISKTYIIFYYMNQKLKLILEEIYFMKKFLILTLA